MLSVALFSACSNTDLPEESSFEKDLKVVATKAMSATLQPYWDKTPITPVFPRPPKKDSAGIAPNPKPQPDPIDYEAEFRAECESFVEVVYPVLERHGAIQEYWEQNSGLNEEDYYDEDGLFDYESFLENTSTPQYRYYLDKVLEGDPSITVESIARNVGLSKFEKVCLAYFIGSEEATAEMDNTMIDLAVNPLDSISTEYVTTKTPSQAY